MKAKILTVASLILLFAGSLCAENNQNADEAALLRQEIEKQELALKALKERLTALEESNENFFEISVSSEGLKVHGKPTPPDKLKKELKGLNKDVGILIRAEPSMSYKEVAVAMELCTKAGFKNITFATIEAESTDSDQPM